jgi:cytochrome c
MNFRSVALLATFVAIVSTSALAAGNAANGAGVFDRCAICHSNTKTGGNKIGPNLFGVVGRKAGTYPGFSFSSALTSSGVVWTNAKLDAWITSPSALVPGNKMPFSGISNAGQRADLIAYLDTLK